MGHGVESEGQKIYHTNIKTAVERARISDVVLVDVPYAGTLAGPVTRLIAAHDIKVPVTEIEFAGQSWLDFLNSKGFAQSKIEELFANPTLTDDQREEYRRWLVTKTKNVESDHNSLGGRLLSVGEIINKIPHNHVPKILGVTALSMRNVALEDFLQVATRGRNVEFENLPLLSGSIVVGGVNAATIFDYATNTDPELRAKQRKFQRELLAGI